MQESRGDAKKALDDYEAEQKAEEEEDEED